MITLPYVEEDDLKVAIAAYDKVSSRIENGFRQAARSHGRQVRIGGYPYLEQHIYPVTREVLECLAGNEVAVCGSLLHDVQEDDTVTDGDLIAVFGMDVFRVVKPLVHGRDFDKVSYRHGLLNSPQEAKIIKLADRANNLRCAHLTDKQKQQAYITDTEEFYIDFARTNSDYFLGLLSELCERLRSGTAMDDAR